MLLGLRTDGPEVTMVLVGETGDVLATTVWQADRQLAHQLLARSRAFWRQSRLVFRSFADCSSTLVQGALLFTDRYHDDQHACVLARCTSGRRRWRRLGADRCAAVGDW